MNNYVISLSSEVTRREHIKSEFNQKNVSFTFFDAITPPDNTECANKLGINISNSALTAGEISCFLSHIMLWKHALDNNLDYIAIFEDDIYLGQNSDLFLNHPDWIPKDCDIIKLEAFYPTIEVEKRKARETLDNRIIYPLVSKHIGGAGYILSQRILKKLFEDIRTRDNFEPLDHYLFEELIVNKEIEVVQILPAICIQDSILNGSHDKFSSSLEDERRIRFNTTTQKITFIQKMKREIFRILNQIKKVIRNIYYKKNVTFR
ncbi:hypothetical protein B9T31_14080 [Acinetobacter sp. ANC 4558]|uniref:glycosyltransferase family 25 protein n=1 Tax=Acinetobacter sp. ANC 4558 TaxID=1977876 RepID=UPI000A34F053|nr:glycosyltransferase family 25 protein [Acinetobacter sp. ANC 4558]OTG83214.1 hypothetical protein B9T31_14080 [Acinetobacter sp. ANC 4558]